MTFNVEETVKQLTDFLKTEAKTETVVGQSFQLGEFTCVPVIKFGIGLGYGAGEGHGDAVGKGKGEGTGGGAGGGVGVEPIGFLTTRGDQISFIQTRSSKGLSAAFEKMPDLLEKMFDKKKTEKAEAMA
ncbi:MAG TPA: spore germination protein GerW family protein [Chitinophagaceae bacterium]